MRLLYPVCSLLSGMLLATSLPGHAQVAPDSVAPRRWLVKAGLSLTHLRYSYTATSWQLQMPATFGIERRLGARYSVYGQLDADCQLGSAATRRRRSPGNSLATALPTTTVDVGGRFYYGQPAGPVQPSLGRPELGRYLALQAEATYERPVTARRSSHAGRGASLTPAVYVLWGVQNRWRSHLLADLNAGAGVLAPAYTTSGEAPFVRHGWDMGLQANVRLYWVR